MKKTLYVFTWAFISLLALPAAAQVPAYVPTDGLVGWWPFNGNANDESGNGNDGVVNGATLTEDRFGNAGNAYVFEKSNSNYIQGNLGLQGNEFTLSVWAKHSSGITGPNPPFDNDWIVTIGSENPINVLEIGVYAGGSNISYGKYNDVLFPTSSQIANTWKNYTITYNSGLSSIFENGQFIESNNGSVIEIASNSTFYFGRQWNPYLEFWDGSLDDIAIYNRALTEQEIQNLYTGTTPPPCASLPSNLQQGLVGYWPFCGNANDESGNGNDGTVNGATMTEDRFGNANAAYGFDGVII